MIRLFVAIVYALDGAKPEGQYTAAAMGHRSCPPMLKGKCPF